MNTIRPKDVYHQPEGIPENLIIWQDENSGIAALVNATNDIINGRKVTFALCDRKGTFPPTVTEIVTIAMGKNGDPSPRYVGEDNDPDGVGSHALIPSWYDYCTQAPAIATALALAFKAHKHYFRLV